MVYPRAAKTECSKIRQGYGPSTVSAKVYNDRKVKRNVYHNSYMEWIATIKSRKQSKTP